MGFSSLDDWIAKITADKQFITFWHKRLGGALQASRWQELCSEPGFPTATMWGEWVKNGDFTNGPACWTLGAGWTEALGGVAVAHAAASALSSIAQTPGVINGRTYRTVFTTSGISGTGNCRIKIGGTAGTNRGTAATFTENIVAGASGIVEIEADAALGVTIDDVSVIQEKAFKAYNDTEQGAICHGGNVTPATKHILSAGHVMGQAAAANVQQLMILDVLGCYPRIDTSLTTEQALTTVTTLPRYTTGVGVRAYLVLTSAMAGAPGLTLKYTNSVGLAGQGLPTTVTCGGGSSIANWICHTATDCGPFLPLAVGDLGIRSVEGIKLATAAVAGTAALVLARPLAVLQNNISADYPQDRDYFYQVPSLPRVYDGAYLAMLAYTGSAVPVLFGQQGGYINLGWG